MVLQEEADHHGWALEHPGSWYSVDKVVFVLERVVSTWLPTDSAAVGFPQSKASKKHTCLWEWGIPSFLCSVITH